MHYVRCPRCGNHFIPPFEDYDGYCPECIEKTAEADC